jgi:hypothetical protein
MAQLDWITNPSDLTLLSLFWTPIPQENAIAITQRDGSPLSCKAATYLVNEKWEKIAQACTAQKFTKAYIYYLCNPATVKTFEIPASFTDEISEVEGEVPAEAVISVAQPLLDELFSLPEHQITEPMLCDSSRPTYINRIFDQENLFANDAALEAQGRKPKFLGQTAYSLNDVDELERRCSLLMSGEILYEYNYQAWRWYFDANAGRWRLKRMAFVSCFRRIDSCNLGRHLQVRSEPMWLGQVLQADELTQRIP